jgi:pimeloyl-ACP methyl ester carboxylesterase
MSRSEPPVAADATPRYLARPQGRIAYTVEGTGPLVVAVPGMGDLRSTYRELTPPLLDAGYRVAVADLRGHGASDTTFTEHGDAATGRDLLALVDHLGGPAVLVGNSMGAAACAWAAAERPDLVAGLVLLAPLLREPPAGTARRAANRLLYRVAFARPWGAAVWAWFYRSLNKGTRAPWLEEHVAAIHANLRAPGRLRSFRDLTLQLDHSLVEKRLHEVAAPAVAVIGSLDPDYPDPAAELTWITTVLDAEPVLVPEVGHYPQHQRPDVVIPATVAFLAALPRDGARWAVGVRG